MRAYDEDVEQQEIEFYGGPADGRRTPTAGCPLLVGAITLHVTAEPAHYVLVACADGSLRYVFAPMIETFAG